MGAEKTQEGGEWAMCWACSREVAVLVEVLAPSY